MKSLAILLALAASALAEPPTHLIPGLEKDPENLLFIGDSITHGFGDPSVIPGDNFHGILQTFFTLRFPEKEIWTANAGRAGDNLGGLLKERMDDRDVFKTFPGVTDKADVAFIMYGMNDGGSLGYLNKDSPPFDKSKAKRLDDYRKRLAAAVEEVKKRDILPIVLSPTMYDETVNKSVKPAHGYNTELARYTTTAAEVAKEKGVMFIDLHTLMTEKNLEKQKDNPKFSYTTDRVHPHAGGAALMAYSVLKALNLESDVFHVEIAANGAAVSGPRATITNLESSPKSLTWTASESSLPFPIDRKTYRFDNAFSDIPFREEFNRQFLKITGLAPGKHTLSIDGKEIAAFVAEELAKGIDLSTHHNTPQYAAALEIRNKLFRKQQLDVIKRDINSLRLNIEGHFGGDIKRKNPEAHEKLSSQDWDAPDVEATLALMDRAIAEKKEDGKNTGGFFGHIAGQTRRNLPNIREINAELAAIRKDLSELPATREYNYVLKID